MSKTKVNQILSAHGNGFVKYKAQGVSFNSPPCYTDRNDKRVKGIYCGQTGPLTVTDAIDQQKVATLHDLVMDLQKVIKKVTDTKFQVSETAKTVTYLYLTEQQYPSYQYSAGMDPDYKGHYIVPVYITEGKA
jgi:hypothetical protein